MIDAGADVTFRRFAGQMHGFFTMVDLLPGAAAGVDFAVESLEPLLGRTRCT